MSLICSRERTSDSEEFALSDVGEETWFSGMDHSEVLKNKGPCSDEDVTKNIRPTKKKPKKIPILEMLLNE